MYAVGIGVVWYVLTVTGSRRKNEKWFSSSYILGLVSSLLTETGLNKVGNLLCEVHVVAVARQKRACAEINTNISPFQPPPFICRI